MIDTTAEYILMCAASLPDLLEYCKVNEKALRPMFIWDTATERVSTLNWAPSSLREKIGTKGDAIILSVEYENDRGIWIPEGEAATRPIVPLWRQDQLQDIYREQYLKAPNKYGWLGMFINFVYGEYQDTGATADEAFDTMEKLWLAFVMKEKFGKVWNGEAWEGAKE